MAVHWKQVAAGIGAAGVGALIAVVAVEVQGGGKVPTDRAAIEQVVRDYVLAHPELIPEAMDKLQGKQTADLVAKNRTAIETPFAGAWTGNPKGDVILVEFADYACGFCRASVGDVERLVGEDKGLKVVFRELPILSPESEVAAKVGLVAAKQGKFYGFHKALYAGGPLSADKIGATASAQGVTNANALAEASDIAAELSDNIGIARALHLSGTPAFIVGDQVLNGAVGYDALKKAVADARAAKRG